MDALEGAADMFGFIHISGERHGSGEPLGDKKEPPADKGSSGGSGLGCGQALYASLTTQRKPMWLVALSIVWGMRAAGR